MHKTKVSKSQRIYLDWACDKYIDVKYTEPIHFHYFQNKDLKLGLVNPSWIHAIGNHNFRSQFTLEDWHCTINDLCFWGTRPTRDVFFKERYAIALTYLPGNSSIKVGDLIHNLIVLAVKQCETAFGISNFCTLLDGDKIIENYPYHTYCDLHENILPKGVRKWKI